MIHSVLVSGDLDDERLYRILGELAGLAMAATPDPELVLVIESNGGSCLSLRSFLECVNADDRTRKALARGGVKIYNAQSAAAVIALSFGRHREMVAGSQIGLHLPLLPVDLIDVDKDNRLVGIPFENCRKTVEVVEEVMERFGLDEPKPQSEIHESGWLRLPALECLKRGVVHRIFGGDGPAVDSGDGAERPAHSETVGRTILISGTLTEQRLGLVLRELLAVAAQESTVDGEVVLVFESNAGELFSTLAFMDEVAQNESLRHLVERARVKIYEACPPAALLAFSWGRSRELAVDAKIQFSLGQLTLQMGNPNQLAADGLLSAQLCKDWRRYRSTVEQLMDRLGLTHDPKLSAKLYACGRLTLTAEDCLKRGIVSRLF